MKKVLIGGLVGTIILFIWQFLSWSLLNIHYPEMQYTENQDKILPVLTENLEEGSYFLPTAPPGTSMEDMEKLQSAVIGKPWAIISYRESFEMDMASNMIRGFVIDLISVMLLIWLLMKFKEITFSSAIGASLAVGFIGYFTIVYLENIWFETGTIGYLIDTVVSWGLIGVWLGFYLKSE